MSRVRIQENSTYSNKNTQALIIKLDVDPQRDDDASPMSTYRCMQLNYVNFELFEKISHFWVSML